MKPVISPLYRVFWDGERFAHSFSPSFSRQPLDRSTLVLLRTLSYVCGTVKVGLSGGLCFSLAFRRAGLCFLNLPVPATGLARSCDGVTGSHQTATGLPR